ncbi:MAG: MBL fold metallo-hydrolase [Xanthomonadaceae bacterium]|nr:MBL fold metallo-hydrolase [Xanthomonadaceae bacterium]
MALATPTASEAVPAVASPSPETIRAHGLLDPAALPRVSRKAGQEPRLMRARARAALPLTPRNLNEIRIHSLPVGAGSCHLIECPGPGNELLLYDCGSTEGARAHFGLDDVRAYLAEVAGERPLKVVVSHADRDHYSHVPKLVAPAQVQTLWLGGLVADYPVAFRTWVAAVQDAQAQGAGEVAADLPAGWSNEGYAVEPLQCGSPLSYVVTVGVGDEKNDHSLVLSIDHGSFRLLLTDDATGETQDSAMANFPFPYLDASVVTAAHHGAESHGSNAADWVAAVRPEIVIYSAGESRAHPRCPVVETYRAAGSLLTAGRHDLRCGTRYGYEAAQPTFLSEYNTFDSGARSWSPRVPHSTPCAWSACRRGVEDVVHPGAVFGGAMGKRCERWPLVVAVIALTTTATAAAQHSARGEAPLSDRGAAQRLEHLSLADVGLRVAPLTDPGASEVPDFAFVIHRPVPTPEGMITARPLVPDERKRQACVESAQAALIVWNRLNDPRRPGAIAAHTSACMSETPLDISVGTVDTAIVRKAIGAIAWIEGTTATVFCTGLALSPRSVVTARHCFGQPLGDTTWGFDPHAGLAACAQAPEGCRLAFLPATGAVSSIPIAGPTQDVQGLIARSNDYFVVRLAADLADVPEVRFVAPAANRGLLVVGPDLREPNPHGSSASLRWLRSADFLPCGIAAIGANTMTHTCQTAPAFSGAPLIVEAGRSDNRGERILVAGLHIGGAEPRDEEFVGPSASQPGWSNTEVLNIALKGDHVAAEGKAQ